MSAQNKELTIIVPGYNEEKSISRCLDSLVAQTCDKLEILVVDDGSTDGTGNIVKNYMEKYANINYIYKENGGISSARNTGLDSINTPYFGFVDSDDYVEPGMFEKMLDTIKNDQSDMCVCNFVWEYPDHKREHIEKKYQGGSEMITGVMATLWNKIYRTDLIKKYDLRFPNGKRYEDTYFLICLAGHEIKISKVEDVFVHYVQHVGSIVHTNNEKVRDMVEVFELIDKYYEEHGLNQKYKKELEFLYAKYFLGSSFMRACQVEDKETRNTLLKDHIDTLYGKYPNFKGNEFLKTFGLGKRIYYKLINKNNYKLVGCILNKTKRGL